MLKAGRDVLFPGFGYGQKLSTLGTVQKSYNSLAHPAFPESASTSISY
jgi:hypothetical protein